MESPKLPSLYAVNNMMYYPDNSMGSSLMKNKFILLGAYFILGTIWNTILLLILAASGSLDLPWYQGLLAGFLCGGIATLIGETAIRAADIALRRQHGVLAFISPSFILRALLTLIPGLIARAMFAGITARVSSPSSDGLHRTVVDPKDLFLDVSSDHEIVESRSQGLPISDGTIISLGNREYQVASHREEDNGNVSYFVRPNH